MAEHMAPGRLGSTSGAEGRATDSTQASGIVGRVREQAAAQLDSQKNKATDGLGSVAQAVRETTQHLREQQHDTVAQYAEQAADQLERFSERLRGKDVGELVTDAQRLARRQPALFVGGAFAIGLLGARFLKSSSRDDYDREPGDFQRGYGGTSAAYSTPNAYGNRVPSVGTASRPTRPISGTRSGLDHPSTEEL
jgi:hypothetical protein